MQDTGRVSARRRSSTRERPFRSPSGKWRSDECSTSSATPSTVIPDVPRGRHLKEESPRWLHQDPPAFARQSTKAELLRRASKRWTLLAPFIKGGKVGLFGGAGVGKTVRDQELIHNVAAGTAATPSSPVSANVSAKATTSITEMKESGCARQDRASYSAR